MSDRLLMTICTGILAGGPLAAAQPTTVVLTHGFTIGSKGEWVEAMGDAILARAGTGTIYRYHFAQTGNNWSFVDTVDGSNDLVVLIFNWTDESDAVNDGPNWGYAQAAGDVLYAAIRDPLYSGAVGPEDLHSCRVMHFVGHSRGTVVNNAAVRRLAAAGIPVDQVTTLDPHPVNGNFPGDFLFNFNWGDDVPQKWDNVTFADNYWRTDTDTFDFNGMPLDNVLNIELDEDALSCCAYGAEHSDVHLWYHGTIDLGLNPCDGEQCITSLMRDTWWPDGYVTSGYYLSISGGGSTERPVQPSGLDPGDVPALYNGSFVEAGYAGWRYHGGAGGSIDAGEFMRLGISDSFATHNRLWLDAAAQQLTFDFEVANPSNDDTLLIYLTNVATSLDFFLDELALSETSPWTDYSVEIPAGVPRDRSYTLTFELDYGLAVESTVHLDNIVIAETGSSTPPVLCGCAEDIDGDSDVGVTDLLTLLGQWGPCGADCSGDINEDDVVDILDLLTLLSAWGPC